MTGSVNDLAWGLDKRLKAAIAKHRVPGASIALYAGDSGVRLSHRQ